LCWNGTNCLERLLTVNIDRITSMEKCFHIHHIQERRSTPCNAELTTYSTYPLATEHKSESYAHAHTQQKMFCQALPTGCLAEQISYRGSRNPRIPTLTIGHVGAYLEIEKKKVGTGSPRTLTEKKEKHKSAFVGQCKVRGWGTEHEQKSVSLAMSRRKSEWSSR
jgi:hypothetical protein